MTLIVVGAVGLSSATGGGVFAAIVGGVIGYIIAMEIVESSKVPPGGYDDDARP